MSLTHGIPIAGVAHWTGQTGQQDRATDSAEEALRKNEPKPRKGLNLSNWWHVVPGELFYHIVGRNGGKDARD